MRVALAAVALLSAAAALPGCPKKPPPEPEEAPAPVVLLPTLARTWSAVTPDLYPELTAPESEGLPTVTRFLRTRDADLFTQVHTTWGPPTLDVIEFLDTDHPDAPIPAVAAWVLAPAAEAAVTDDPLASAVTGGLTRLRRRGERVSERQVRAVLLRDFTGAPTAAAPADLALGLGERFAPPWELCAPVQHEGRAVAYDPSRGLKLGFALDSSKNEGPWFVDHIEFLPVRFEPAAWFESKGYGGCEPLGSITSGGRFKEPAPKKDAS